MKSKIFLLLTVLAVMLGGTAAFAQETDDDTVPDANTGFVATIAGDSIGDAPDANAETLYIRYHVCSLNLDADNSCGATLGDGDFNPESFDGWSEIAVEPNEEGDFNHGSFVSAFAKGFEGGPGKGCVLRFIAQSDWGKEGFDIANDDLLIEAQTSCAFHKAPGGDAVEGEEDEGNGPPPWAGKGKRAWADGDEEAASSEKGGGGPPPWAGKSGGPKNTDD